MANAFQFRSLLGMGQQAADPGAKRANAHSKNEALGSSSRTNRSDQMRDSLDVLMRQIEHARRDADQMMAEMSDLEVSAGQAGILQRENDNLREQLDDAVRATSAETSKAESAAREIVRLKDELARIRQDYEASQREASANAMDATRLEDRLRVTISALEETKRELEIERDAKDKAEVEAKSLQASLAERDRTQSNLKQAATELRMENAKLQNQYDEVTDALARKERAILEKVAELETTRDRMADLESEADTSREELRVLGKKYSDLKISQDARVFSLNDGLDQERESHRMTRKLLDEERARNDDLSDEIAALKDQTLSSTKEAQRLKRELSATRAQVHEYGEKLKEASLQQASALTDIQRLESSMDEAKRTTLSLQRQASKSEQLLRENSELHSKIVNLQETLDRYRGKELRDEVPIMLSGAARPSNRTSPANTGSAKAKEVAVTSPNVARIRRR